MLHQEGHSSDWFENDDRLPLEQQESAYYIRNQQDWWEQNKKIRAWLDDMDVKVRAGQVASARTVTWSNIARELSCDRGTLKHPRRYHWVNTRRTQLLELIKKTKTQKLKSDQPEVLELSKEESVAALRTQLALLYDRYILLEHEILRLRRLIAIRDARIKELLSSLSDGIQQVTN